MRLIGFLALLLTLLGCSGDLPQNKKEEIKQSQDSIKVEIEERENELKAVKEEMAVEAKPKNYFLPLIGTWVSDFHIKEGDTLNADNPFILILKSDSTYEISSYSAGPRAWEVKSDTLTLSNKAVDDYKILSITDSSLFFEDVHMKEMYYHFLKK